MSARVLVVANDHVGSSMAGPGIRSLRFATELAADHEVTLVVPFATDIDVDGIRIVLDDPWDPTRMRRRLRGHDVVIAQKLPVSTMRSLARSDIVAIYDLYAPVAIEALASGLQHNSSRRVEVAHRLNAAMQEVTLAAGDAFICASEKQRDLWLGGLLALGRVDQGLYDQDPSLRGLVDVVPFGIEQQPPTPGAPVLAGVVPGIDTDDKVLLWGGGIWNWFDPLTVIRAVERIARQRGDVRLYFLGLKHPNPAVPQMEMERRAVALAEELGLRDRIVFFNDGWVPYEQRGSYYLESSLGVSSHFDNLETRFAYRTRLLDCVWSGLPIVTTTGDAMSDLVSTRGLGRVVPVADVEAWVRAITELLDDQDEQVAIRERLASTREDFLWPRVVEPLRRLIRETTPLRRRVPAMTIARYRRARGENAVLQHGARHAAATGLRMVTGRTRPLEERVQPPLP